MGKKAPRFGDIIREDREKLGMSRRLYADRIEVSFASLKHYESLAKPPSRMQVRIRNRFIEYFGPRMAPYFPGSADGSAPLRDQNERLIRLCGEQQLRIHELEETVERMRGMLNGHATERRA